jgi:hypothetical protein
MMINSHALLLPARLDVGKRFEAIRTVARSDVAR